MAKKRGRPKSPRIKALEANLIRQLYWVMDGIRFSPQVKNQAYLKTWYNGDLEKLQVAARKIINITEAILRERKLLRLGYRKTAVDAEVNKIYEKMGIKNV